VEKLAGIGISSSYDEGPYLILFAVIKGSPAEKAGLHRGDAITAIDGNSIVGSTYEKAMALVLGPEGTSVTLTVFRGGKEFDVTAIRALVTAPEFTISYRARIPVVYMLQFGLSTEKSFRALIEKLNKKKLRGMVIDLRDNNGGFMSSTKVAASAFLPEGTSIARFPHLNGELTVKTDLKPVLASGTPLVVLVSRGTAGAAEVFASVLRDTKRATLVGQTTFGAASVDVVGLGETGEIQRELYGKWLTALGRDVGGKGLLPDVVVPEDPPRDPALAKAIRLLLRRAR
jgi:carboxyl-terminal processing protease